MALLVRLVPTLACVHTHAKDVPLEPVQLLDFMGNGMHWRHASIPHETLRSRGGVRSLPNLVVNLLGLVHRVNVELLGRKQVADEQHNVGAHREWTDG